MEDRKPLEQLRTQQRVGKRLKAQKKKPHQRKFGTGADAASFMGSKNYCQFVAGKGETNTPVGVPA